MKRILSSILVVVLLVMSLVGCGYSLADDDMAKYATFSDAEKKAFEEALKLIKIEDGEFILNADLREEKVVEAVYAALADALGEDAEQLKTGKPDGRDTVYYCYYVTADFDGTNAVLYTAKYKTSAALSIQLRPSGNYGDDTFAKSLYDLFADYYANASFEDKVYKDVTSGTAVEGDIAYVTYTKTLDGDDKAEPEIYTSHKVVIGAAPASGATATTLESYLCGKAINSSIEKFTVKEADDKSYTYSNIKINWVSSRVTSGKTEIGDKAYVSYTKQVGDEKAVKITNELVVVGAAVAEGATAANLASFISGKEIGLALVGNLEATENEKTVKYSNVTVNWVAGDDKPIGTVVDKTFDEETLVDDTTGVERDLNGVELTYHIYPVYYTETPEFTVTSLLLDILGEEDLTADNLINIIFANEYAALDDDATEEEINAVKELAVKYKTSDNLSIADLVGKITKYYDDIKTADKALENANTALTKAQTAYDTAKAEFEEAKKAENPDADKIAELEKKFKDADEALNGKAGEAEDKKTGAKADKERAQTEYDNIGKDRDDNVKKLLAITAEGETETLETKLYNGYKILQYNNLQYQYNMEIKNKLAKEIYFFLTENIAVGDKLPEEAVDDAYTQIYETYENEFYTGYYNSTSKVSNYKQYKGDFDKYLIAQVTEDIKTVKTVKEAKAAITEKAREAVAPLVELFLAAQTYDVVVTDKDYEEFKDKLEDYYYYYILYYKNFSIEEMLGKTNMTAAAQFNKLMDWFLEFEEVKAETVDKNGYTEITYKYTNDIFGDYEIGDPASEAEDNAEK